MVVKPRRSPGTPFITNVAKEVYQKTKQDRPEKTAKREPQQTLKLDTYTGNQPTLKLEMFAPPQRPEKPTGLYQPYAPFIQMPAIDQRFNPASFSPAAFQHLFAPNVAYGYGPNVKMPVQQVYNISLPGPTGGHVEMNKIYENILPGKEGKFTATTLGERLQIYEYLRQILVKVQEGEDIGLESEGQNNLMSYIKFLEINPTFYSPLTTNPYKGLPYGLLVYRSCFPIRMDRLSQGIICDKNSIGLNIRLYSLSLAEYISYKFQQLVYKEYDVWRELSYYQYIRENVLKKKRSPNFPLLYAFFLCNNQRIDFFSLKKNCLTQKDVLTLEYQKFVVRHSIISAVKPSDEVIRPISIPEAARKVIAKLPDEIDPTLQAYSGTTLILITEAPHHNIYQWASRIYERDGIIRKMVSHGFHDEKVWMNVLFQIISALYIMQIDGIYMGNMTLGDNIFIKDLQVQGKSMSHWKYIIDGVPFYVHNHGYLVFVDSNFKDIYPPGTTITRHNRQYKIYTSDIIGKKYKLDQIRDKVFENYRSIINTNAFTKEHTQNNVSHPPESVMKLIEKMMVDPEKNLGKVLFTHFRPFLNNRIGTLLKKDTEVPHIREITKQFNKGDMAVEVVEDQLYKWCIISQVKADGMIEIVTKQDPSHTDFISKDVRLETLKQYSASEKIEQNVTDADISLTEENLLETYQYGMTI